MIRCQLKRVIYTGLAFGVLSSLAVILFQSNTVLFQPLVLDSAAFAPPQDVQAINETNEAFASASIRQTSVILEQKAVQNETKHDTGTGTVTTSRPFRRTTNHPTGGNKSIWDRATQLMSIEQQQREPIFSGMQWCKLCEDAKVGNKSRCLKKIRNARKADPSYAGLLRVRTQIAAEFRECRVCGPAHCAVHVKTGIPFDRAAPRFYRAISHILPSLERSANASIPKRWVYNPTLVPMPKLLQDDLPQGVYLASFRVSTEPGGKMRNFLGLAVLDAELAILRDVVVDFNAEVNQQFGSMQDFRLFIHQSTLFVADQSYVVAVKVTTAVVPTSMANMVGTGLYLSLVSSTVKHIPQLPSTGKNFNYFADAKGDLYVELWPSKPRMIAMVHATDSSMFANATAFFLNDTRVKETSLTPSFISDEVLLHKPPWLFSGDRGTACCAQLELDHWRDLISVDPFNTTFLMVGVAHAKSLKRLHVSETVKRYSYLSRLYAFHPSHPLEVVAISGAFCLGYPSKEEGFTGHPLDDPTVVLRAKTITYSCPPVHFPTGIIASETNSSNIILAYGIEDYSSRMLEISKRELALRLFASLPELG
jgi:hypothetical protein